MGYWCPRFNLTRAQFSVLILTQLTLGAAAAYGASTEDESELSRRRSWFEEPLIATAPTSSREYAALLGAIRAYQSPADTDDFAALHSFLSNPCSDWLIGLLAKLGLYYYHHGYFSKAIDSWETAWRTGVAITEPYVDDDFPYI